MLRSAQPPSQLCVLLQSTCVVAQGTGPTHLFHRVPALVCAVVLLSVSLAPNEAYAQSSYDCRDGELMDELANRARVDAINGSVGLERFQSLDLDCDLSLCETPGVKERLMSVMDVCVGAPYTKKIADAARARLMQTGFFEEIVFDAKPVPGGYEVRVDMLGATVIRDVDYVGNAPLLESEVAKRLSVRKGQPWRRDAEHIKIQTDAVRELYKEHGFFGTEVGIVSTAVAGTRHLVDVKIKIEKGRELEVRNVTIKGNKHFSDSDVRDAFLDAIPWLGSYNERTLTEGANSVVKAYRDAGYFGARVLEKSAKANRKEGLVDIALEVKEGPHWEVVFIGNKEYLDSDLLEVITFGKTGYVDATEMKRSAEAIHAFYETVGFSFAQVRARETQRTGQRRRVTFRIVEGNRAEVRAIEIAGNKGVSAKDILSVMATKPYDIFSSAGYLQRAQLAGDLDRIVALYQSRGYLRVRVPKWRLVARKGGEDLYLRVTIEEGPQTRVADALQIVGNQEVSTVDLAEKTNMRRGTPFALAGLKADADRITRAYRPLGYPAVRVKTECSADGGATFDVCALPTVSPDCFPKSEEERLAEGLCTTTRQGGEVIETCRRGFEDRGCGYSTLR